MNVRPETIKLLKGNIALSSLTWILVIILRGLDSNSKAKKSKINKWDYKLKSFCTAKETINKMKDNLLTEKIYLQITSGKGLISKTFFKKPHITQ